MIYWNFIDLHWWISVSGRCLTYLCGYSLIRVYFNYIVWWGTSSACGNFQCFIQRMWLYEKCSVCWWIITITLDMLIETTNLLLIVIAQKYFNWNEKVIKKYTCFRMFDGYKRYFLLWPILTKDLHKYSYKICELFWEVKRGIYIYIKTPKINNYKNFSQFTKQLWGIKKILAHDTFQRLNCVTGCFNVKFVGKLVDIINSQLCGKFKWW